MNKLPSGYSDQELAESFSGFFESKVEKIVSELPVMDVSVSHGSSSSGTVFFNEFESCSPSQILKIRSVKCCDLDFLPRDVFKRFWPQMVPVVTKIVNLALSTGIFPQIFKTAHVQPLIKSPSLDDSLLKSYRPISNLSFVSKVLESVINLQLQVHFEDNKLLDNYQSAYRIGHSVETALSHVHDSIMKQLDRGRTVFLVLLDLSAAFDTISHKHLLHVLENRFHIGPNVLNLISSYLTNRFTRVRVGTSLSAPKLCPYGVPQGSILGPVFFNCIMSELPSTLKDIGISSHLYADDTQFWVSFKSGDESIARRRVSHAFKIISRFMSCNSLKLNASKTQFLPIGRSIVHSDVAPLALDDNTLISPSSDVRNLGITFDNQMNYGKHISGVRKAGFQQLKRLSSIRSYVPSNLYKTLIQSYISSKLDFCNSLFANLPDTAINRIQNLQNACAKSIMKKKKSDSASEQLRHLHWLPVKCRIQYKVSLWCHKSVHSKQSVPAYISDKLIVRHAQRFTRSSLGIVLEQGYSAKLDSAGMRSLESFGPAVWNSLPVDLRAISKYDSFKKALKTYYFRQCYV